LTSFGRGLHAEGAEAGHGGDPIPVRPMGHPPLYVDLSETCFTAFAGLAFDGKACDEGSDINGRRRLRDRKESIFGRILESVTETSPEKEKQYL
jgi:hypothetical protein